MDTTMYALIVTGDGNLKRSRMEHQAGDTWRDRGCEWTGTLIGYQQGHRIWTRTSLSCPNVTVVAGQELRIALGGSIHGPTEAEEAKARIDWLAEHGYLDLMPGLTVLMIPESRQ